MQPDDPRASSLPRRAVRILCGAGFATIGVMHFVHPAPFVQIVPPLFPAPLWMVWISGAAEIAGGVGLLVPPLRRAAGIGLLALLVAVYPANLYMAFEQIVPPGMPPWVLWARLPFQFVFAALVTYASGPWGPRRARP